MISARNVTFISGLAQTRSTTAASSFDFFFRLKIGISVSGIGLLLVFYLSKRRMSAFFRLLATELLARRSGRFPYRVKYRTRLWFLFRAAHSSGDYSRGKAPR